MRTRRHLCFFLSAAPLALASCGGAQPQEALHPQQAIESAQIAFQTNQRADLNSSLNSLRLRGYDIPSNEARSLVAYSPERLTLLSGENALFLATGLELDSDRACACGLYRFAIEDLFKTTPLQQLLSRHSGYTRAMILLGRSATECQDSRSVLLRSILATGTGVGYPSSALKLIAADRESESTRQTLLGLSSWVRNDYDRAYFHFSSARNAGESFGLLDSGSIFLERYSILGHRVEHREALRLARNRIDELAHNLDLTTEKRNKLLHDLLLPDLLDISLSALEVGDGELSRNARAIGNILTLVDMLRLLDSMNTASRLRTSITRTRKEVEISADHETLADRTAANELPGVPTNVLQRIIDYLMESSDRGTALLLRRCD